MTLTKEQRILKRRDFLRVQRFGSRSFGRFVVVIAKKDRDKSIGKFGITVPKKVGVAHDRNKIKRRIRHILRENQELFFEKFLVIIAKDTANDVPFLQLYKDILDACRRLQHSRPKLTSRNQFISKNIA
jgi:ribonuclease P protein component